MVPPRAQESEQEEGQGEGQGQTRRRRRGRTGLTQFDGSSAVSCVFGADVDLCCRMRYSITLGGWGARTEKMWRLWLTLVKWPSFSWFSWRSDMRGVFCRGLQSAFCAGTLRFSGKRPRLLFLSTRSKHTQDYFLSPSNIYATCIPRADTCTPSQKAKNT